MKPLIYILLLSMIETVCAQGLCSLRNPQAKIKTLSPQLQKYKTLIATINEDARVKLNRILPFEIHYYETGRHNLYLISNKNEVKGLVHARTEPSKWGLVEIAWSLDLNLKIKDFTFQRCRTSAKTEILQPRIKEIFQGKGFYDLLEDVPPVNTTNLSENAQKLYKLIYKSALKTIALTDLCWKQELRKVRVPDQMTIQKYSTHANILIKAIQKSSGLHFTAHDSSKADLEFSGVFTKQNISQFYSPVTPDLNQQKVNKIKAHIEALFRTKQ